ncbi:MAG: ParB/RepB/Spo0J family partition protein [Planctomycetes bacterium]|nr:ParB/RepB/Spo0J family partition protein [Planctomycetota bacterium]
MKERRLGRGLDSLLGAPVEAAPASDVLQIPIDHLVPNPHQPRKIFSDEEMRDLVRSIREQGILQPILVRRTGQQYELIAGERRLRAAREIGLTTLPALVKELNDEQMLEVALIENTQRADLNPIERAQAYRELMLRFQLTQDQAAGRLGLERSTIANFVRLLELPPEIQDAVSRETISQGHARALLAIKDPVEQLAVAKRIEKEGLSVRQVEHVARGRRRTAPKSAVRAAHLTELEERIRGKLGSKVKIDAHGNRGCICIEYYSLEHFEQILQKLGV